MRLIDTTDERLYTPVAKIENPSSLSIRLLRDKMLKIVRAERGDSITANQVGKSIALFIMRHNSSYLTCINPVIQWKSDEVEKYQESCISFPSISLKLLRAKTVIGSYVDLKGQSHITTFSGNSSMRFQHCVDLLQGKTFIQHEQI
jgi:peptide deformylase